MRDDERFHYVVGGQTQVVRPKADNARTLDTAVIIKVDLATGTAERAVEYRTPPAACADVNPSITFKSSTIRDGLLYACTETEVLVYRLPGFTLERYVSLPLFNDLHHVMPTDDGNLLIAVTGLDMVVEIDGRDRVVREWDTSDQGLWTRFSRDIDYRKIADTRPRISHPNFVYTIGDDIWVNRSDLSDAQCLTAPERRVQIVLEGVRDDRYPHDGHVYQGHVYFTAVDGHVIVADARTDQVVRFVDTAAIFPRGDRPGWCRGLKNLSADRVLIGYTRLRRTRLAERTAWLKSRVKTAIGIDEGAQAIVSLPTQVALVDMAAGRLETSMNLEQHGMNAVFSIL